ncbi:PadR family transcriptional regulator [Actinomadura viridis]|uniref:PadR family transcriptional regulator n=1 Tax=Actinomadura viridis TaxID=58110 RepID=UPI00368BFD99
MYGSEARSLLHPFLLLLICERPGHGYELIDRLACLGVPDVEPGHAYRVLRNLERERLVVSTWVPSETGPARRRYELTREGLADLGSWMARLARLGEVLDACVTRWGKAAARAAARGTDASAPGPRPPGGRVPGGRRSSSAVT